MSTARFPEPVVSAVKRVFLRRLYAENAEDPKKRQALFFGQPEIDFLVERAMEALATALWKGRVKARALFREERENMRTLKNGADWRRRFLAAW